MSPSQAIIAYALLAFALCVIGSAARAHNRAQMRRKSRAAGHSTKSQRRLP